MYEKDLTVQEVAELLQLHQETVRRWLREDKFPNAYQFGRRGGWRIPRASLDAVRFAKPADAD